MAGGENRNALICNPLLTLSIPSIGLQRIERDYETRCCRSSFWPPPTPRGGSKLVKKPLGPPGSRGSPHLGSPQQHVHFSAQKQRNGHSALLGAGHWIVRSSPLCLRRWTPSFSPKGEKPSLYLVWVELTDPTNTTLS